MLSAGLYRGISRWGCGLFGTPMRSIEPWIGWESSLLRLGTGWWPNEDSWGGQRALARSIFRWPRTCFIRRGLPLIFFCCRIQSVSLQNQPCIYQIFRARTSQLDLTPSKENTIPITTVPVRTLQSHLPYKFPDKSSQPCCRNLRRHCWSTSSSSASL